MFIRVLSDMEDDNDFLCQLCKLSGKLLKGGEPDLMTAAKMVPHDWQRGKIPFFVPPPKRESPRGEADIDHNKDDSVSTIPVQGDLFSEEELKGNERPEQLPATEGSARSPESDDEVSSTVTLRMTGMNSRGILKTSERPTHICAREGVLTNVVT
ncbi:hypothetical protein DVH24_003168 [Malus domestica]|uniref:Uncharacterized protein n=1 Tax=Malus domestica TaxID=3750 RepID=A0A498K4B3_MALDO|nr:hypothetical protein DVH24_003168 [Malus domestica]